MKNINSKKSSEIYMNSSDLLEKYLEFKSIIKNPKDWKYKYFRYKRKYKNYLFESILSLMQAYNLGQNIYEDLRGGSFIIERTTTDYKYLYQDIDKFVVDHKLHDKIRIYENDKLRKLQLHFMYINFVKFIENINNENYTSQWLIADSVDSRYIIYKIKNIINSKGPEQIENLKKIICHFIDLENKKFSLEELIKKYNYPIIDLSK